MWIPQPRLKPWTTEIASCLPCRPAGGRQAGVATHFKKSARLLAMTFLRNLLKGISTLRLTSFAPLDKLGIFVRTPSLRFGRSQYAQYQKALRFTQCQKQEKPISGLFLFLAARPGLEPGSDDPESSVLPLNDRAINLLILRLRRSYMLNVSIYRCRGGDGNCSRNPSHSRR